jgi:hypothetical protein
MNFFVQMIIGIVHLLYLSPPFTSQICTFALTAHFFFFFFLNIVLIHFFLFPQRFGVLTHRPHFTRTVVPGREKNLYRQPAANQTYL